MPQADLLQEITNALADEWGAQTEDERQALAPEAARVLAEMELARIGSSGPSDPIQPDTVWA